MKSTIEEIEKQLDLVSAQCIFGLNIIKDMFFFVRGIVGVKIEDTYSNANNGSILSVFTTSQVVKIKATKTNYYECNKRLF